MNTPVRGRRLNQPGRTESLDPFSRCINAALRYLSYRPRSEAELRARLFAHGFGAGVVEEVLSRLRDKDLVDDTDFASFWVENRESFSPRSRRALEMELRGKGISPHIIARATAAVDEMESAYRAARTKCRSKRFSDIYEFRRRLAPALRRLGFDHEVIAETVNRLWREQAGTSSSHGDSGGREG
ncbi:regulatory protein RecX [Chloroflexota bacterium]